MKLIPAYSRGVPARNHARKKESHFIGTCGRKVWNFKREQITVSEQQKCRLLSAEIGRHLWYCSIKFQGFCMKFDRWTDRIEQNRMATSYDYSAFQLLSSSITELLSPSMWCFWVQQWLTKLLFSIRQSTTFDLFPASLVSVSFLDFPIYDFGKS